MHALIMAGGEGRRINLGEKPLVLVCGRPMISYITDAFIGAGVDPVVAASPKTPFLLLAEPLKKQQMENYGEP